MDIKFSTFFKSLMGGLCVFGMGCVAGYFFNYTSIDENSAANAQMVTICHKGAGNVTQTMVVPMGSLRAHLEHGDQVGACGTILPDPVEHIISKD